MLVMFTTAGLTLATRPATSGTPRSVGGTANGAGVPEGPPPTLDSAGIVPLGMARWPSVLGAGEARRRHPIGRTRPSARTTGSVARIWLAKVEPVRRQEKTD